MPPAKEFRYFVAVMAATPPGWAGVAGPDVAALASSAVAEVERAPFVGVGATP